MKKWKIITGTTWTNISAEKVNLRNLLRYFYSAFVAEIGDFVTLEVKFLRHLLVRVVASLQRSSKQQNAFR